ncbi:MAG: MBL fold metallo-hydrolase [Acidobacteria bacterium]|nr:MBL fold metallo-hydrolase [Acidobacteriota bacterium]
MMVDVLLHSVGHCHNRAWFVEHGSLFHHLYLPSLVAVIRHPEAGVILFDTGYGQPLVESISWAARLYRAVLPFQLTPFDIGGPINAIFLSHFHPDHIGSLSELPQVPILHSREGLATLNRFSPIRRALSAYLPELLPSDFTSRARAIEDRPLIALNPSWKPFNEAYDIAGDGSLLAIALPGHALGQYGLACRIRDNKWIFLVADAAWTIRNITELALPGWPAGALIGDAVSYRNTLFNLHKFHQHRPEVRLIPSHCYDSMTAFQNEQ